jgi:anhydro-N-acetylmuramic acid kinase
MATGRRSGTTTMLVVGMISGTSADAIEAVLVEVTGAPPSLGQRSVAGITVPIAPALQRRIHAIAADQGGIEAITHLDVELGEAFAQAALDVIAEAGLSPEDVGLIGSHGQTVWHAVRPEGSVVGTIQIGNAAVIAERTGITTVSALRSRDIAAGGQGAPLVAYVDSLLLRHPTRSRAVQNLGGIGNVAWLPALGDRDARMLAFDTGPANVLIDVVMGLVSDGAMTFDADGAMAASGTVDEAWVERLLEHPYFDLRPPKTTGRELFSPAMGAELLAEGRARELTDADVIATLTAYSAASVAEQYRRFLSAVPDEVIAAGGGTRNPVLMAELRRRLPAESALTTIDELGIASHQKEALAMAVIAYETWHGRPGTIPELTGARHATVAGSITPGRPPA